MLLPSPTGYQVVIHTKEGKGQLAEEAIHEALESLGGIHHRQHEDVFEKPEGGYNHCFPQHPLGPSHLMISFHFTRVNFGEKLAPIQLIADIKEAEQRIIAYAVSKSRQQITATGRGHCSAGQCWPPIGTGFLPQPTVTSQDLVGSFSQTMTVTGSLQCNAYHEEVMVE